MFTIFIIIIWAAISAYLINNPESAELIINEIKQPKFAKSRIAFCVLWPLVLLVWLVTLSYTLIKGKLKKS